MANAGAVGILKAVLTADTTSFDAGMKKAADGPKAVEKSVTGLTKEVTKLTPQAERMVKAFSGDKMLYQANNLVAAVERLGGAQNLTAREMAKVNREMTEAIAKAKLLGHTVPSSMTQLEQATRKATAPTSALASKISGLGLAVGAFAAGAAVMAAKQVFDFASTLTDLSARTGLSTTALQKLQLTFEQSGVGIETVAKASDELGARLAGDKGAGALIKTLGLNLQALQQMAPEDRLFKVGDAVAHIANQGERVLAAKTLFGKGGVEMLQALDGHLEETTKKFEAMGLIIDEQTIKAADDFGDQMGLIGKQLLAVLGNAIGPMLPALSALASGFSVVASVLGQTLGFVLKGVTIAFAGLWHVIADLFANIGELAMKIPIVGKHLTGLAGATDWLHKSAASAEAMVYKLALGTTETGTAAKAATAPMIGIGDAIQGTGKKAEWTAAQLAKINAQIAAFDAADRSVELFFGTVTQDMLRQGIKKPEPAKLLDPNAGSLATIDRSAMKNILNAEPGMRGDRTARQIDQVVNVWRERWAQLQEDLSRTFGDNLSQMLVGLRGFKDTFLNIWDSIRQSFANILSGMLQNFLGGFLGKLTGGLSGALGSAVQGGVAGSAIGGGAAAFAGLLTGGGASAGLGTLADVLPASTTAAGAGIGSTIAGLATNPFTIAAAGGLLLGLGIWKKGWFRGGEEGVQVNPARGKFQEQFGGLAGLQGKLTQALIRSGQPEAGAKADGLIRAMNAAHTMKAFRLSEDRIAAAFSLAGIRNVKKFNFGGFVPPNITQPALLHGGSMGEMVVPLQTLAAMKSGGDMHLHQTFNINAIDSRGVKEFVNSREFIEPVIHAFRQNRHFVATEVKKTL